MGASGASGSLFFGALLFDGVKISVLFIASDGMDGDVSIQLLLEFRLLRDLVNIQGFMGEQLVFSGVTRHKNLALSLGDHGGS